MKKEQENEWNTAFLVGYMDGMKEKQPKLWYCLRITGGHNLFFKTIEERNKFLEDIKPAAYMTYCVVKE